jgi:hypothetical protein
MDFDSLSMSKPIRARASSGGACGSVSGLLSSTKIRNLMNKRHLSADMISGDIKYGEIYKKVELSITSILQFQTRTNCKFNPKYILR